MSAIATRVVLSEGEQAELERWVRLPTTEQRLALRARIVLAAANGEGSASIARREGVRLNTVSTWRMRFAKAGVAALEDEPRTGRPRLYDEFVERRILAKLDEPPPSGYAVWNGTLLAERLSNIPADQVWRILRRNGVQLQRRRSWCISTDPEFAPKAAEIVGLYLAPPENAVVLCIDEKPGIQALERAQGFLKLPDGKAVRGQSHEYKRHGVTTLFAALEVTTGSVTGMHANRNRLEEFLSLMNQLVAAYPGQEMHVILDNFSTHKPKNDAWLLRHPDVHFHFTPTHASWLNQVETWFSILSRSALRGSSFTSVRAVCERIDSFIRDYNRSCRPFRWRAKAVAPSAPKPKIADLL